MAQRLPAHAAQQASLLPPAVRRVVRQIEDHIIANSYCAGDRYRSVREVAVAHRVSLVTAHRAVRELERCGVLCLRPRSGAYIASAAGDRGLAGVGNGPGPGALHVLMPDDRPTRERFLLGGLQAGLLSALPAIGSLQFQFLLPGEQGIAQAMRLIADEDSRATHRQMLGAVLIRVGRAIRQAFAARRVPAVVIGTAEDDTPLPSVGVDQRELARMAMRYLERRSRRRNVLIMRSDWDLGDNVLVEEMQRQGSAIARELQVRSVPAEPELIAPLVKRLLVDKPWPDAFICRSDVIAEPVAEVVRRAGGTMNKVSIVSLSGTHLAAARADALGIVRIFSDDREMGRLAVELLLAARADPTVPPRRVHQALSLIEPLSSS